MIRVCHMTSAHRNDDGRIFKKECTSLARAGYDVTLVAQGDSFESNGVRVIGVQRRSGRLERMLLASRDVYKAATSVDADIYHFHDPELLPYGAKLAKAGKCVIFDSHENYSSQIMMKEYLPGVLRNSISGLYRAYETYVCKRLAAVITPCRFGGESIFDGRAKCVAFVGNGCLEDACFVANLGSADRADSICCLGSLTPARGITHLVRAAYRAGVRLILCGPIDKAYLAQLQSMDEFKCAEYRGLLSREELPAVMSECFAGVAAGLNVGQYALAETLPTKVSEYLLNGLPVLLFDSPFNRAFMEKCKCGYIISTDDVDSFAKSINDLRVMVESGVDFAQTCREYALSHLTWKHDEAALLKLYENLSRSLN